MLKPDSLRAFVAARLVDSSGAKILERDPAKLAIFIDQGRIAGRSGGSLGFEWRYRLQAIFTDFPAALVDAVALLVMLWIADNQPELLLNHQSGNEAVKFDADIIDAHTIDLSLELQLNEAVDAKPRDDGGLDLVHRGEPDPAPPFDDVPEGTRLSKVYLDGALILEAPTEPAG